MSGMLLYLCGRGNSNPGEVRKTALPSRKRKGEQFGERKQPRLLTEGLLERPQGVSVSNRGPVRRPLVSTHRKPKHENKLWRFLGK